MMNNLGEEVIKGLVLIAIAMFVGGMAAVGIGYTLSQLLSAHVTIH